MFLLLMDRHKVFKKIRILKKHYIVHKIFNKKTEKKFNLSLSFALKAVKAMSYDAQIHTVGRSILVVASKTYKIGQN